MVNTEVYSASEKFKYGWVAGFYDALTDDGMRYLDDVLRYGVGDNGDRKDFMAGYRAGRRARAGQVRDHLEPMASFFQTAA
jgi:hypothetical protein